MILYPVLSVHSGQLTNDNDLLADHNVVRLVVDRGAGRLLFNSIVTTAVQVLHDDLDNIECLAAGAAKPSLHAFLQRRGNIEGIQTFYVFFRVTHVAFNSVCY